MIAQFFGLPKPTRIDGLENNKVNLKICLSGPMLT